MVISWVAFSADAVKLPEFCFFKTVLFFVSNAVFYLIRHKNPPLGKNRRGKKWNSVRTVYYIPTIS